MIANNPRNKIRFWLAMLLRCHHKRFEYEEAGGKACPNATGDTDYYPCSMPVYEVYCRDCDMHWTLGEDELISFFARQRQ